MGDYSKCEFCAHPFIYEPKDVGHRIECPQCQLVMTIVGPEDSRHFISSKQYLQLARTTTAYRGTRVLWAVLTAIMVIGGPMIYWFGVVRPIAHVPGVMSNFIAFVVLSVMGSIAFYLLVVAFLDLLDVNLTKGRLDLQERASHRR